jgi:hypothetical protein
MAAASVAVLGVYRSGFGFLATAPVAAAFAGLALQLAMVAAIAVFFSAFTNSTLAAIFTLGLTLAGQFSSAAIPFWRGRPVARALSLVVPNLPSLDFKVEVVYETAIAPGRLWLALAYGLLYVALVIALACGVFSRRDLR